MANATDLLTKIGEALQQDTKFRTWCQNNLGQYCNIYMGINKRSPPPLSVYPMIAIYGVARVNRGSVSNKKSYDVEMEVGVIKDSMTIDGTQGQGQLFTLDGFKLAEGLRDEAELAIFRKGINNRWKVDTNGDTVSDNDGRAFRSASLISIDTIAGSESPVQ